MEESPAKILKTRIQVYSYACMTSQVPSPSHWEWVPWKRSLREQTTKREGGRERGKEKERR